MNNYNPKIKELYDQVYKKTGKPPSNKLISKAIMASKLSYNKSQRDELQDWKHVPQILRPTAKITCPMKEDNYKVGRKKYFIQGKGR